MVKPQHFSKLTKKDAGPPLPHIHWQDVIELDSSMNQDDRAKITYALQKIENTKIGQIKFAKAKNIQTLIPAQALKEPYISGEPAELVEANNRLILRRTESPKIFISTLDESDKGTALYKVITAHGGGGYAGKNIITLHLPTFEQNRVPRMNANGIEQLLTEPFSAGLIHEIQHSVDEEKRLWVTPEPRLSLPCSEEYAMKTENIFLSEIKEPLRAEYMAPELFLRDQVTQRGKIITTIDSVKDNVVMNVGCKTVSETEVNEQTRQIFINLGVKADLLHSLDSTDAPLGATPPAPIHLSRQIKAQAQLQPSNVHQKH